MKLVLVCLLTLLSLAFQSQRTYHRILFIGNSLTITHVAPELGWDGRWGMAASQADKDYVHRVQLSLTAQQGFAPEITIISADLHRWQSASVEIESAAQKLDPDLVIVQMGEHATIDTPYAVYLAAYQQIITWTPNARHIAMGLWGGPLDDVRGQYIERVASETGMQYIPIRDLHTEANTATEYSNTMVAWHPNDTGHAEIAGEIIKALSAIWLPTVGGCMSTIPCEGE